MAADPRLVEAADHFQRGRHREAALGCEAVLAGTPDNVDALHLLGLIRHVQGDHASALTLLNTAVARAPDAAELHSNRLHVRVPSARMSASASGKGASTRPYAQRRPTCRLALLRAGPSHVLVPSL